MDVNFSETKNLEFSQRLPVYCCSSPQLNLSRANSGIGRSKVFRYFEIPELSMEMSGTTVEQRSSHMQIPFKPRVSRGAKYPQQTPTYNAHCHHVHDVTFVLVASATVPEFRVTVIPRECVWTGVAIFICCFAKTPPSDVSPARVCQLLLSLLGPTVPRISSLCTNSAP